MEKLLTLMLAAHPWIHTSTTETDSPGYENTDPYTLIFDSDGTASSTMTGEGWSGISWSISGNIITLGEGEEEIIYEIVTLTDDELVFTEAYEEGVATMKFIK